MSPTLERTDRPFNVSSTSDVRLRHRLKVVEDLWESVLRQECGQQMVDLLHELNPMQAEGGQAPNLKDSPVVRKIEQLDLNDAIRAARGFALYFQLINIVEQHYEQRDQQKANVSNNLTFTEESISRVESPSEEFSELTTGSVQTPERGPWLPVPPTATTECSPQSDPETPRSTRYSSRVHRAPHGDCTPHHSGQTASDCPGVTPT